MFVPVQQLDASSWALADYAQAAAAADVDAGTITVTFEQVPDGELWLVDRIVVSCTSTTATRALVYDGDPSDPRRIWDGTQSGNFDAADNASPIQLPAGSQLVVVWSDEPDPGSRGTAFAQWAIMRRPA